MKPFEPIKLAIPVVLLKEGDYFLISCDTLAVYAQSKDLKNAVDGFIKSTEHFFNLLHKQGEGKLEDFLYSKNVVATSFEKINVEKYPEPNLELGHYVNWYVPATARPQSRQMAYA